VTRYMVPLNEDTDEEGEPQTVTVDVLTMYGTARSKRKQWRKYIAVRTGNPDVHEADRIAIALDFPELAGQKK